MRDLRRSAKLLARQAASPYYWVRAIVYAKRIEELEREVWDLEADVFELRLHKERLFGSLTRFVQATDSPSIEDTRKAYNDAIDALNETS